MEKIFVASYSGGKDSILAFHMAVSQGMIPLALITTYNTEQNCSWFHGIPQTVLDNVAESIGIPVRLIKTSGDEYTKNFERTLCTAKEQGAQFCVFGDIDIEDHFKWCTERCENAGLLPMFPLRGQSRRSVVNEFINRGFTAHISIVDTTRMGENFLGKKLTAELLAEIEAQGIDVCGENGEYHTFVSDGPVFKKPVKFTFGEKISINGRVALSF